LHEKKKDIHTELQITERGSQDFDETSQKIIDATMALVRDKGYVATTTKELARRADVVPEFFENVMWELETDLEMFMRAYIDRMTPDFVNLSIGLRAPQLYEETKQLIMKVPQAFLESFTAYLKRMCERGKIPERDFDALAMMVFSATFGYTRWDKQIFRLIEGDEVLLGLSVNEVIEELNNDFCAFQVSEFLEKSGFLQDKQPCITEDLQRLIFLQGNQEEVYTVLERKFIEQVGKVYMLLGPNPTGLISMSGLILCVIIMLIKLPTAKMVKGVNDGNGR